MNSDGCKYFKRHTNGNIAPVFLPKEFSRATVPIAGVLGFYGSGLISSVVGKTSDRTFVFYCMNPKLAGFDFVASRNTGKMFSHFFTNPEIISDLLDLHDNYVVIPTDKAFCFCFEAYYYVSWVNLI